MTKLSVHTILASSVAAITCGFAIASGVSSDASFATLFACVMLSTWMK